MNKLYPSYLLSGGQCAHLEQGKCDQMMSQDLRVSSHLESCL